MNTAKIVYKKRIIPNEQKRKIEKTRKHVDKLQAEIAPFIKKRKFMEHSLEEQWVNTYHFDVVG